MCRLLNTTRSTHHCNIHTVKHIAAISKSVEDNSKLTIFRGLSSALKSWILYLDVDHSYVACVVEQRRTWFLTRYLHQQTTLARKELEEASLVIVNLEKVTVWGAQ